MNASPKEAMHKGMTVWVGVNMSMTISVSMSPIVDVDNSVIINMSVKINLNASLCLGMTRYGMRTAFKVNSKDSR